MLIGALISAIILVTIIKMFTDENTSIITAFLASIVAAFVARFLSAVACAPVESPWLKIAFASIISLVVTGVVVQLLCSTDLRTVIKISVAYFIVNLVLLVVLVFALSAVA